MMILATTSLGGALMRPSKWLLLALSTIKSQSNTLTIQQQHEGGGPGNGRMEQLESGIQNQKRSRKRKQKRKRNPNLRNKNWRRLCLQSVTNNNCSIKSFHPHIIFIYCYYIFYCRIFCVLRKIFLREFHICVSVATWDHD